MGISDKPLLPAGSEDLSFDRPIPPGADQDAILRYEMKLQIAAL